MWTFLDRAASPKGVSAIFLLLVFLFRSPAARPNNSAQSTQCRALCPHPSTA